MNHIEGDYTRVIRADSSEDWFGEVRLDGKPLPLAPSLEVFNHSPDGFAWGYGGSGPAQLALALLLAAGVPRDKAVWLHQKFKHEFIARVPNHAPFALDVDILGWVNAQPEPRL